MDFAEVTRETFEPYLEKTFHASTGDDPAFELRLIEVSPMGETVGPNGRKAFSLVLRGPESDAPEQGIYRIDHQELGTLDLFLVPIGPDADGMKYEAVFT